MGRILRYLSHPQVAVDGNTPVPQWSLSDVGRERVVALGAPAPLAQTTTIYSSAETKAVETAEILGAALGLPFAQVDTMGENDRSATGFLEPAEFEKVADQFFANPRGSIRGWEKAVDAQARIVTATKTVLENHNTGDMLLVGHGAVGTLLYCHFADLPIDRSHDQTGGGGGNFWALDLETMQPIHPWRPMEDWANTNGQ